MVLVRERKHLDEIGCGKPQNSSPPNPSALTHLHQLRVGEAIPERGLALRLAGRADGVRVLGGAAGPLEVIGQLGPLLPGRGVVPHDLLALGRLRVHVQNRLPVPPRGEERRTLKSRSQTS